MMFKLAMVLAAAATTSQVYDVTNYTLRTVVPFIGPKNVTHVDQGIAINGAYYQTDRDNGLVQIVDLHSGITAGQLSNFSGRVTLLIDGVNKTSNDYGGPNGLAYIPERSELYIGDGFGKVQVHNLFTRQRIASISTGGQYRCDELAYSSKYGIVMVTNGAEDIPFVSFIDITTQKVVRKYIFNVTGLIPTNGLEGPSYDSYNDLFYQAIPETDGQPNGIIGVFSPINYTLIRTIVQPPCNAHAAIPITADTVALCCSADQFASFNISQAYISQFTYR
jgi:hypothetical protein